ncbi:MAG TPA: hypothetical protein PLZ20_14020 [Nitrospira sp.]|nr:hypothetical protein [Nitrospira sp.]
MLFESLALAEQLSLLLKTSSHDEEALSALASSIKSGIPDLHLPLSDSASKDSDTTGSCRLFVTHHCPFH